MVTLLLLACEPKGAEARPDTSGDTSMHAGPADEDEDGYPADTDCDDADATVHPGATEGCNGQDDDCDGLVDDEDAPPLEGQSTWYLDGDRDGWGGDAAEEACSAPSGFAGMSGDCDDADATVHPDAAELCDGADQDCDGVADDTCATAPWGELGADDAQAVIEGPCPASRVGTRTVVADVDADGLADVLTAASCTADAWRVLGVAGPFPPRSALDLDADVVLRGSESSGEMRLRTFGADDVDHDGAVDLLADVELPAHDWGMESLLFRQAGYGLTPEDADLAVRMETPGDEPVEIPVTMVTTLIPGEPGAIVMTGSWMIDADQGRYETWVASADTDGTVGTTSLGTVGPDARTGSYFAPLVPGSPGDLDGDGEGELVLGLADQLDVYLGPMAPGGDERPADLRLGYFSPTSPDGFDPNFGPTQGADLDDDGLDDLLVTTSWLDEETRTAHVAVLRASLDDAAPLDFDAPVISWPEGVVPHMLAFAAADVDGDGALDLALPDTHSDVPYDTAGAVNVEYGPFAGGRIVGEAGATLRGSALFASFGYAVDAGDTNGDGVDDLAVGSELGEQADQVGAVWIFLGGARGGP